MREEVEQKEKESLRYSEVSFALPAPLFISVTVMQVWVWATIMAAGSEAGLHLVKEEKSLNDVMRSALRLRSHRMFFLS